MAWSISSSETALVVGNGSNEIVRVRVQEMRPLAHNQWLMIVKGDDNLPDFFPGQFAMLSFAEGTDPFLPRAFPIVAREKGAYHFIYRIVEKFTRTLTRFSVGQTLGLLGPLGVGIDDDFLAIKKIVVVADGIGFASLLPLLERIKELKGPPPLIYYGVRRDLETIRRWPYPAQMASDDGSIGFKGLVHDFLTTKRNEWEKADAFFVGGSSVMMRAVYSVLPPTTSYYFLDETLSCGTGICMACRVEVKDSLGNCKGLRACIEGVVMRGDRLEAWAAGE